MIAALLLAAAAPVAMQVDAVAAKYQLAGEVLVAQGDKLLVHKAYGTVAPNGGVRHRKNEQWRFASITKQVTATAIMRMVARGDASLDGPIAGQQKLEGITIRMLLTHHSGLANPDATPVTDGGFPAFYRAKAPDLGYCSSKPATPQRTLRLQ